MYSGVSCGGLCTFNVVSYDVEGYTCGFEQSIFKLESTSNPFSLITVISPDLLLCVISFEKTF